MEGIPEEDLREHEKRLAGKDKDDSEPSISTKATPIVGLPPMPPMGMMPAPPMMPMAFTGLPFGMPPMPLPMMPVQMMAQLRPPMPMMPPVPGNPAGVHQSNSVISGAPTPNKPLFPSGTIDVSEILLNKIFDDEKTFLSRPMVILMVRSIVQQVYRIMVQGQH